MTTHAWLYRGLGVLLLVTAVTIVQGCGQQQETAKAPEAPGTATETTALATSLVSGEILSVNAEASTVEVQDASGTKWVFGVNPTTTITQDGKTLQLAELAQGTTVDVLHAQGSGQAGEMLIAKAIAVKP